MVLHSAFRPQDVELERGVILGRSMYEDSRGSGWPRCSPGPVVPGPGPPHSRNRLVPPGHRRGGRWLLPPALCGGKHHPVPSPAALRTRISRRLPGLSAVPRANALFSPGGVQKSALVKKKRSSRTTCSWPSPSPFPPPTPGAIPWQPSTTFWGRDEQPAVPAGTGSRGAACATPIYSYTSAACQRRGPRHLCGSGEKSQFDALTLIRRSFSVCGRRASPKELSAPEQLKTSLLMGLEST